jgi:hypothetical protein
MIPISSFGGLAVKVWEAINLRGLKKLAWTLRDYADLVRHKEPNLHGFPKSTLATVLGNSGHRIREVLEFMEQKGWAVKKHSPADCWDIN